MPVIVRVIVAVLVVRVIMRMIVLMVVAVMGVRMLVRRVVATAGVVMRMGVVAIVMLVAVIMAVVVVIVPVVMMVMPVMLVGVSLVRVGVFGRFIGACVGLEGRLDMRNLRAEPAHHVFQHVVAAHANAVGEDFGLRVPVADVIGHARKLPRIGAAHLGQFFRRSDDLDQPAVFQNQRVAAPQRHGFGKSSRNSVPRVPVIATRRRWRPSWSRTMVSAGVACQAPLLLMKFARIMFLPCRWLRLHTCRFNMSGRGQRRGISARSIHEVALGHG